MDARTEKLVQVYQAQDEWEGAILVGYLGDNGIEGALREPSSLLPFDGTERRSARERVLGIAVLEHDAVRARTLIDEFKAAIADDSLLAETAAEHLQLDKETIHRLRRELVEEKRTFETLGWMVVVFLGAAALLWAIWPSWLKIAAPPTGLRWVMIFVLILGAVAAGSWANNKSQ